MGNCTSCMGRDETTWGSQAPFTLHNVLFAMHITVSTHFYFYEQSNISILGTHTLSKIQNRVEFPASTKNTNKDLLG